MVPLQMLLAALCGWLEREQRDVIAFLGEENRALRAQLGSRRLRLTMGNVGVWPSSVSGSDGPYCATWQRS